MTELIGLRIHLTGKDFISVVGIPRRVKAKTETKDRRGMHTTYKKRPGSHPLGLTDSETSQLLLLAVDAFWARGVALKHLTSLTRPCVKFPNSLNQCHEALTPVASSNGFWAITTRL
jgi:hypothetical protein